MSLHDDRFQYEGDGTVDQMTMDECEAALEAVEEVRESLKAVARQGLRKIADLRLRLVDRQDYTCRSSTRPIEIVEACENLADDISAALDAALLDGELRRARTILETGRDD